MESKHAIARIACRGGTRLAQMCDEGRAHHPRDEEAEVRGEQRWPLLAKTLDSIKALGKPVYEKVAIPLLLEMLKK